MKKITTVLAFIFAITLVKGQQTNLLPFDVVKGRLEKSIEKSEHPKKGLKSKTWLQLADAYILAGEVNTQGVRPQMPQMEANILLGAPQTKDQKEIKGTAYEVYKYEHIELYFSESGLTFWKDLDVIDENAFEKAQESLNKALELDEKGKYKDDVKEKFIDLAGKYKANAINYYQMGDYKKATEAFEQMHKINAKEEINVTDTAMLYFTAISFAELKEDDKAIEYYQKCIDNDYTYEGNVYNYMANLMLKKEEAEEAVKVLEKGFAKYPKNANIMATLINAYNKIGKDPKDVIALIDKAIELNPENSSLYSVKGNLYEKLGNNEKATESYNKAIEINENDLYAYYSLGNMFVNKANAYIKEANELPPSDFKAYDAKIKLADEQFKLAIPHLEKAHEIQPDDKDILDVLKRLLFRFRNENEAMKKKYEEVQAKLDAM